MRKFVWKMLAAWLLLSGGWCVVSAQSEALISSEEQSLLERLSKGKRRVDWANMNIQFSSSADALFTDGELDEAAFKVNRVRLEILGAFSKKFSYHYRQSLNQVTHSNDKVVSPTS